MADSTPPRLVPRYAARLGLLQEFGVKAFAECWSCGRKSDLDIPALIERLGSDINIIDLEPRLRCTSCQQRGNWIRLDQTPG